MLDFSAVLLSGEGRSGWDIYSRLAAVTAAFTLALQKGEPLFNTLS